MGIAASKNCDLEPAVPYALFENDEQLTRPFRTEREVWDAAEQADLITLDTHGKKILDNNFVIKPCEATPEELAGANPAIAFPEAKDASSSRGNGSDEQPLPSPRKTTRETSS